VRRAVEDSDCPPRPIVASLRRVFRKRKPELLVHSTAPKEVRARHQVVGFIGLSPHVTFISCARISLAVVSRMPV
jgi:hypothetical protein